MKEKSQPNTFVAELAPHLAGKLEQGLKEQGFLLSRPPYTLFSGKKRGVSCTLYSSGKLVVQGKEMAEFIEFYLEPEILGSFAFTHAEEKAALPDHIGIDEAGKGDLFGPLCIAGLFATSEQIATLREMGVKDSKNMSDAAVLALAQKIKKRFCHHVIALFPAKYNELYGKFHNLNRLLAWGHSAAIETLVDKSGCREVIIDQFANEQVVLDAVARKKLEINLTQRHKAEEDPVVAGASILARSAFLEGLEALSREFGVLLPKGASSSTIAAGKRWVARNGREALGKVAKLHFKTIDAIG